MMGQLYYVVLTILVVFASFSRCLELKNGAYDDLVIELTEAVPVENCRTILEHLETTLTSASQYLFSALDSRAYLRSATVLLPQSWPDTCAPSSSPSLAVVASGSGETPDVTVLPQGPVRGPIYTQQSLGCGQPGDQIYLAYETLMRRDATLARTFVKEFARYRYGVFDEQGYYNDPIYPMCYYDDQKNGEAKVTGCSDLPIHDNGICKGTSTEYNTTKMVDEKARSSIMFAAEASSVSMFCDDGIHDRFAPTKHNLICQRRSVLNVILSHSDFLPDTLANTNNLNSNQITDTTPKITYKKQNLTRYVFVIENSQDMMQRESWSYLRLAMRFWALHILPKNTEVGMVLTDETSNEGLKLVSVNKNDNNNRDKFYSAMPYTPSESIQQSCLHCAIKKAVDMLNDRTKSNGPASNVVVVIAPGMDTNQQIYKVIDEARKLKIRIAAINYPTVVRSQSLNMLAERTNGAAYTVFEQKLNVYTTLLSTYFELHNVLYSIVQRFYSGNQAELPMEIHRRQIMNDGRNTVTGSFMLDENMTDGTQFTFFTHNTITPLFKNLKLISPSHKVYTSSIDRYIDFKRILLNANISEVGSWSYSVEPFLGNPQPHFLQVFATPASATVPVVRARFWTHRNEPGGPLILLVEVKRGESPVLAAKVEVTVTKPEINGSIPNKHKFELLDTGAGDPDITKGDGVYTRYFSAADLGAGLYSFEVLVTDNGNTAYTWSTKVDSDTVGKPCCGNAFTSSSGVTPISPFQRILPKITTVITDEDIAKTSKISVGRIGDLKVEIIAEDMKARLSWTSPDMGGQSVSRYEIKYAMSITDIMDKFETIAVSWDNGQPYPLAPGSDTTFSLDMSETKGLLDKPLYFAIKAYARESSDLASPISNWVRVLVPAPPPPPSAPPTFSTHDHSFWPNNNNGVGVDSISPSIAKTMHIGLELILPVAIGFILLVVILVLYCYFCVVKRRDHHASHKKSSKSDKLSSAITIIPSSPSQNLSSHQSYTPVDLPDPHQIGVPTINSFDYEDENKKRYSLVNQQEQQLIEELKQQQLAHLQQRDTNNMYAGLSVISNGTLTRNGHTLSPYNSWSASQLLHEHERRHSPLENMMQDDVMMGQQQHQQDLMMNGSQLDHMSLNGQSIDHMSLNGHQVVGHVPPPVPPLPAFNANGYPINYNIYGIHHQGAPAANSQQNSHQQQIYQSMQRNETLVPFNPSLQGSLSSVNSGDKKRRNVTMV